MAFKFLDRACQSVQGTPGTGAVTLSGALAGYQTLSVAGANNGDTFSYLVVDGTSWEYGVGTFSSTGLNGTLVRTTVTMTSAGNTTPLSFSSKCNVSAVIRGEDIPQGGVSVLSGLLDVSVVDTALADDDVLTWNTSVNKWQGKAGGGGGGGGSLSGLSDVTLTSPSNSQALLYQTGASKWENESLATVALTGAYSDLSGKPTIPTNGSFDLSSLGDVVITSLATDDVVGWNGSHWTNRAESGGGGGGSGTLTTIANNGTDVDTAAVTLNFVNATSVTTSGHDVTVTLPSGGVSPTPPTVVQSGVFAQGDAPYTMGSTPTAGNLLVALVSHWSSSVTVGAGWTMLLNVNGSNDCESIFIKVATSADTTSLSPCTTSNDGVCTTIYELAGAAYATPVLLGEFHDVSSTSQSISTYSPGNSMVLGHFTTTAGDTLPTLSGVTAGPTVQEASGTGSGYARGVAAFYKSMSTAGTVTASGTYGSSVDANGAIIVIQGAGSV